MPTPEEAAKEVSDICTRPWPPNNLLCVKTVPARSFVLSGNEPWPKEIRFGHIRRMGNTILPTVYTDQGGVCYESLEAMVQAGWYVD